MTRTPKLEKCDPYSFFSSLLTLAQFGLEPDGRRAHLIPFENRKRGVVECQLIIDYKGLVELILRSGVVSYVHADVICENDQFDYDRGELKTHKIDFRQPRGPVYAAYSMCRFKDGGEKVEVMTRDEIESIRNRSKAGQNGPWVTDWNEMAKKTVFRRLSKWLPLSPEYRDALDVDDDRITDDKLQIAKPVFSETVSMLTPPEEPNDMPTANDPEEAAMGFAPTEKPAPKHEPVKKQSTPKPASAPAPEPEKPQPNPEVVKQIEPDNYYFKNSQKAERSPEQEVEVQRILDRAGVTKEQVEENERQVADLLGQPQKPAAPAATPAPQAATPEEVMAVAIVGKIEQYGVTWAAVADWLVQNKWVRDKPGTVKDLISTSPRKAKMLLDSFGKVAEAILGVA
jgi:recombination protein RecT